MNFINLLYILWYYDILYYYIYYDIIYHDRSLSFFSIYDSLLDFYMTLCISCTFLFFSMLHNFLLCNGCFTKYIIANWLLIPPTYIFRQIYFFYFNWNSFCVFSLQYIPFYNQVQKFMFVLNFQPFYFMVISL